jgi:hypothetical protein
MSLLLNPPIVVTKKKVFFDPHKRAYFLEVSYSYGRADLYGPFTTALEAQSFV